MPPTKPIIVLIPGAFHRPSHYNDVIQPLQSLGFTVLSIPLVVAGDHDVSPSATPADDVAAIHAELLPLLDAGHTAVIVAHSYGSTVATACIRHQTKSERVARNLPGGITGLVSIAGFAFPAKGKNILGGDGDLPLREHRTLKDGLVSLLPGAKEAFYGDVAPEKADVAFAGLCKFQSWKSMNVHPEFIEREIEVPKMYVFCEKDQTVAPAFQEKFVKIGGFDKVVRLSSGHSPFLTAPGEVVKAVVEFCEEAAGI
ncbi:hypothetical protein OQA88_8010 [Cercophora sp. LCS_1]